MTRAQKEALLWLFKHGNTGVFLKWPQHHVLMAQGGAAPFMYSTWMQLVAGKFISKEGKRLTVTMLGAAMCAKLNSLMRVPEDAYHPISDDYEDD